MSWVKVVGQDPSYSNWGLAIGELEVHTGECRILELVTVSPVKMEGKQVRVSSIDVDRAQQLYEGVLPYLAGAAASFVEVPVGSQSASAMKGYGACISLLASMRHHGYPFIELTPNDIKLAGHGTKGATKKQMIQWAYERHPEAPWPTQTRKGVTSVVASQAEHMADAVAAIHAGVRTPEFQRMLPLLRRAA